MPTYAISYDLDGPPGEYRPLREAIKDYRNWWHFLPGVWLVDTPDSAPAIRDRLGRYLSRADDLLVVELGGDWATLGFSDDAADWLSRHVG